MAGFEGVVVEGCDITFGFPLFFIGSGGRAFKQHAVPCVYKPNLLKVRERGRLIQSTLAITDG